MEYDKNWITTYTPRRCIADYYSDEDLANYISFGDIIDMLNPTFKDSGEYKKKYKYNLKHIELLRRQFKKDFEENKRRSEEENKRFGYTR